MTRGNKHIGTYRTWCDMRYRCLNERHEQFKNYGARGITVCERWMRYEDFLEDMGERPKGLTLDRINNDGNYEKRNCRWATAAEQRINQRTVNWLTYKGESKPLRHWAIQFGMSEQTLHDRLNKRMMTVDEALDTPIDPSFRRNYKQPQPTESGASE